MMRSGVLERQAFIEHWERNESLIDESLGLYGHIGLEFV